MDWVQTITYLAFTGIFLYVFQRVINERAEKRVEKFKTSLQSEEFKHETQFAKLHEERAKIIVEIYRRLDILERSLVPSSQGIHLLADLEIPKDLALEDSKKLFALTIEKFVDFRDYFTENRILLSKSLCKKIEELIHIYSDTLSDLEGSFDFVTPPTGGLPHAIGSLWNAQKKIKVIIPPIKHEIEQEFRNILGVDDINAKQLSNDFPK
jgi:hypothetical protein